MREWAAWRERLQLQFPPALSKCHLVAGGENEWTVGEMTGVLRTCVEFSVALCSKECACSAPSKLKPWCCFPLFSSLGENYELLYVFLTSPESWDVEKRKCIDTCVCWRIGKILASTRAAIKSMNLLICFIFFIVFSRILCYVLHVGASASPLPWPYEVLWWHDELWGKSCPHWWLLQPKSHIPLSPTWRCHRPFGLQNHGITVAGGTL